MSLFVFALFQIDSNTSSQHKEACDSLNLPENSEEIARNFLHLTTQANSSTFSEFFSSVQKTCPPIFFLLLSDK